MLSSDRPAKVASGSRGTVTRARLRGGTKWSEHCPAPITTDGDRRGPVGQVPHSRDSSRTSARIWLSVSLTVSPTVDSDVACSQPSLHHGLDIQLYPIYAHEIGESAPRHSDSEPETTDTGIHRHLCPLSPHGYSWLSACLSPLLLRKRASQDGKRRESAAKRYVGGATRPRPSPFQGTRVIPSQSAAKAGNPCFVQLRSVVLLRSTGGMTSA